jgi:predicted O-methyltransferase YrrM
MLVYYKIVSRLHGFMERSHRRRTSYASSHAVEPLCALQTLAKDKISELPIFLEEFHTVAGQIRAATKLPGTADMTLISVLYALIRMRSPSAVIETGVWHGVSSFIILKALKMSGGGTLCSIDIPPLNPRNRIVVGGFVPDELRESWDLHIGPATKLLPQIVDRAMAHGGFDMFVHDSDHNYFNMMREFRISWPALKPAGILIADDAHTNDAVLDFADEVGRNAVFITRQKGGAIAVVIK